jgi:hypothetical protein
LLRFKGMTLQRSRKGAEMTSNPTPPIPEQQQNEVPGRTAPMNPKPDHGEHSYQGHGRLAGKAAVVTGGNSGIGRAVGI